MSVRRVYASDSEHGRTVKVTLPEYNSAQWAESAHYVRDCMRSLKEACLFLAKERRALRLMVRPVDGRGLPTINVKDGTLTETAYSSAYVNPLLVCYTADELGDRAPDRKKAKATWARESAPNAARSIPGVKMVYTGPDGKPLLISPVLAPNGYKAVSQYSRYSKKNPNRFAGC